MSKNKLNGRGFNDWNNKVDNFDYNKRVSEIDGKFVKPKESNENEPIFGELNDKIDEKINNANKACSEQNLNEMTQNSDEQNAQEYSHENYKKSKHELIAEQIIADLQNKNSETQSKCEPAKELGADIMEKRKGDFPMLVAIFVSHCILFGLAIMLFFIKLNTSEIGKDLINYFFSIFLVILYVALLFIELFLQLKCQKRAGKALILTSILLIFPTIGILIP